jgi:hypothetical protein
MTWKLLRRVFDFFASIELAVFVLLSLSVVLAVGTVVESKYGMQISQEIVYRSFWTQGLLWLLLVNVTTVALSRLPWKRHHVGFLITHLGIIILLLGSFITQRFGIDASMPVGIGESARTLRMEENYLNVFKAIEGQSYNLALSERLHWNILRPLKGVKQWILSDQEKLSVLQYYPKALRDIALEKKPEGSGVPGMQFRIKGSRADMVEYLFLQSPSSSTKDLGPAQVKIVAELPKPSKVEKPTLYVVSTKSKPLPSLFVAMPNVPNKLLALGVAEIGKLIPLGWMDFAFQLEQYSNSAAPTVTYRSLSQDQTPPLGTFAVEAIEVEMRGQKHWLEVGASAQVASQGALYYIQFVRRTIDIGFELFLKDFKVGYYPGTNRAMTYSSLVKVGDEEVLIAMNEPMYKNGYTFYQSSFDNDESGKPVLSVFSVNFDPGRWIKYLGSLMIVLGILSMFYFKPMYSGKSKWLKPREKELA